MKDRIKNIVVTGMIAVMAVAGMSALPVQTALAGSPAPAPSPADQITSGVNGAGGAGQKGLNANIEIIINILLFLIGAVSVIMIILGGIRYVLSNGEAAQITGAKNTILYAVIGLIVALLAYAIVNFVVKQFI